MKEKQIAEIEARSGSVPWWSDDELNNLILHDIPALIAEVRRLRSVLAEYADRENWIVPYKGLAIRVDMWRKNEPGYTRAEECLREDGE